MKDNRNCASGSLPERAPLASAYVPMQESAEPNYEPATALARGTLFPGLDLPFMNMVNQPGPATPLSELMAVDFVADELRLYLDTHKDDTEAFEMLQRILALSSQAHREYAEKYGPITPGDMLGDKKFCWLSGPWPWELRTRREG